MEKFAKTMRDMGMAQAQLMRDKARAKAMKRKEEYLGARVPKELRAKVIARAAEQGIPVSILIRNILEQAFSTEGQASEGLNKTVNVSDAFPAVIGWEQITLNRQMNCSSCAAVIQPGAVVALGLTGPGEDHVILCGKCKVTT